MKSFNSVKFIENALKSKQVDFIEYDALLSINLKNNYIIFIDYTYHYISIWKGSKHFKTIHIKKEDSEHIYNMFYNAYFNAA